MCVCVYVYTCMHKHIFVRVIKVETMRRERKFLSEESRRKEKAKVEYILWWSIGSQGVVLFRGVALLE